MEITQEKLTEVATYILDGMNEEEACVLANIDKAKLILLKEENEEVRKYIDEKFIKFKHKHLKEIQKSKNEKNSMWLLEKLRYDEFGGKGKSSPTTINIISAIVKSIQNGEQQSVLSPRNRGDADIKENENDRGPRLIESVLS